MNCVSASGKYLGREPSAEVLAAFAALPATERAPGAVAVPALAASEQLISDPPAGGLVLKVHARFLSRTEQGELRYARADDFPLMRDPDAFRLFLEPNTEYLWLTEEEWRSLLPAEPVRGQTQAVSAAIVDRMARFHLTPRRAMTSEDGILRRSDVQSAALSISVDEVSPARIRFVLTGFIHTGADFEAAKATTPNGPLAFGFATPLYGILEFDRQKDAFVRFDIAAPGEVWGRWGDANGNSLFAERPGRTPFGFAFELASGDSPTDRLPPGGNGGRALANGYFATGQTRN
jgi:hypothetical protein